MMAKPVVIVCIFPINYDPNESYPLIFNLHGFGSNGFEQELYSEFSNISDTANVIVVYPRREQIMPGMPDLSLVVLMMWGLYQPYWIH